MTRSSTAAARPVAHLNARISAYLVDSVVLVAFILIFLVIGGAVLLFSSDLGSGDPPDSAYYGSLAVFLGGSLLSWTAFNLALMRWRGQTTGMYVLGIKIVREDDDELTTGRTFLRWFGLHPLLFHPLLLPVWAILSLLVVSLTLSQVALIVTLTLALLCLASPAGSLAAMLLDSERRALHDRLARTLVVHLDQP
ncbi:MAG: RDD family protein [Dehalococcoidia bacterium]|nr:RDD family protein [Dehalococcoidia bacterium]MDZ4278095.1 RDD family protein [Dehalococcoidia bacterium]